MTVATEKAVDSINHSFLMCVLKKFGLGNEFQKWIQTLMRNPELCVINGGKITLSFKLERRPNFDISLYYCFKSSFFFN